jgi:sporulation protein YlmC with PRC-barrel domain
MRFLSIVPAATLALAVAIGTPAVSYAQVAGSAKIPTDTGTLKIVSLGYRASKLIKSPVYNLDGKKIGLVNDIIITRDAAVSYFIVDVGGFLGIGEKQVAVPAGTFSFVDKKLVLPGVTADDLKKLPTFKYSSL